jgi:carbon monoxide dehydrogenase subunit G
MEYRRKIDIDAPPEVVWRLLEDIERWPEWTSSMQKIERLDSGPLAVGSRARVKQPKLPPTVFTVTELEPSKSFAWKAKSPGVESFADHEIEPRDGGSRMTLLFQVTGALAGAVSLFASGLIGRYVDTEAEGVKRRAEAH